MIFLNDVTTNHNYSITTWKFKLLRFKWLTNSNEKVLRTNLFLWFYVWKLLFLWHNFFIILKSMKPLNCEFKSQTTVILSCKIYSLDVNLISINKHICVHMNHNLWFCKMIECVGGDGRWKVSVKLPNDHELERISSSCCRFQYFLQNYLE